MYLSIIYHNKEVQGFGTVADVEKFLLEHGEQVIDVLGSEVDRVESEIKVQLSIILNLS